MNDPPKMVHRSTMERRIRAMKREREAMKVLNMDTKQISKSIKQKIYDYENFCDTAKVKSDINRLRYESGTSDLKKTEAWKKYSDEIKEYRIIGHKNSKVTINDRIHLLEMVNNLPRNAIMALKDVTFCLNSEIGGGYWYGYKTIYLPQNASKREFYHEVGHHLEAVLFDEKGVDNLKNKLVQGLTENDIISMKAVDSNGNKTNVYVLNSEKFINEYQARLYIHDKKEAVNTDGSINIDLLGEVISVAVEHYFMFPKSTKKNFPDMYKIVEDALNEQKKIFR